MSPSLFHWRPFMRAFYNSILDFILATSLTDEEFATTVAIVPVYDQATYDDLSRILLSRGNVTDMQARLVSYYAARGVAVSPASAGDSNIFIGSVL